MLLEGKVDGGFLNLSIPRREKLDKEESQEIACRLIIRLSGTVNVCIGTGCLTVLALDSAYMGLEGPSLRLGFITKSRQWI